MAKKKKRKAKMPALSTVDTAIYILLFLAALVLIYGVLWATLFIARKIAFADADVIAFREHAAIFWVLPLILTLVVLLGAGIDNAYIAKLPLFGRRDITYGPPKWRDCYPLFSKNRPKKKRTPAQERSARQTVILLSIWIGLCAAVTPLAVYGRDCLYIDGSICIYNMWNVETDRYRADDMAALIFETYRDDGEWGHGVTVELQNGKSLWFADHNFRGGASETLLYMERLKSAAPRHVLRYEGTEHLDDVIEDLHIEDENEVKRLYALFDLQP